MTDNPIPTRAPSRPLEIPEAAYDAADHYFANKSDDDDLLGAVDVAAPHIVAAELRRLVSGMCTNDALYLLRRADELDGGA